MANTWIQALKEWNKGTPTHCVPRKGTSEHKEVMKIQNKLKKKAPRAAPRAAPTGPKITAAITKAREGRTQAQVDDLLFDNVLFERGIDGLWFTAYSDDEPANRTLTKTQMTKVIARRWRELRKILKMRPTDKAIKHALFEGDITNEDGTFDNDSLNTDAKQIYKLITTGVKNYRNT